MITTLQNSMRFSLCEKAAKDIEYFLEYAIIDSSNQFDTLVTIKLNRIIEEITKYPNVYGPLTYGEKDSLNSLISTIYVENRNKY